MPTYIFIFSIIILISILTIHPIGCIHVYLLRGILRGRKISYSGGGYRNFQVLTYPRLQFRLPMPYNPHMALVAENRALLADLAQKSCLASPSPEADLDLTAPSPPQEPHPSTDPESASYSSKFDSMPEGSGYNRPLDLVHSARYEDVARRLIMQQSVREIAAAHKISVGTLQTIMRQPGLIEAFEKAKDSVFSNLDSLIRDEKAAPLLRARAQTIRAQTLLAEIMEEVRSRIGGNIAKAADLKVGSETAFGIIDRAKTEVGLNESRTIVSVEANLALHAGTSATAGEAIRESGIDLSDVIDVTPVEPVEVQESDESTEASPPA